MKRFFLDVETTGLDYYRNEIITLSISAYDKYVKNDDLYLTIRPERLKYWSKEAELAHGISIQQSLLFDEKKDSFSELMRFIDRYSDGNAMLICHAFDKFKTQNLFDVNFLKVGLEECGFYWSFRRSVKQFGSTDTIFREATQRGDFDKLPSYALNKLCDHFKIPLKHHDVVSDREACEQLYFKAKELGIV